MSFIHLHNHSDYSLLDGAASVKAYAAKAKELGMSAIALTDHGNMYGAVAFYDACRDAGVKPIIGCEFYHTRDNTVKDPENKYSHLILLAMNDNGYHNLMKLQKISWTDGYYYKPRIDDKALEKYSENLICLSGCVAGELSRLVLADKTDEAENRMLWFRNLFGDRFYVEIQNHGISEEQKAFSTLVRLAQKHNIPLAATNDCHYISRDDSDAHDTLLCVDTKALKTDTDRLTYKPGEFYFRTENEMYTLFPGVPEAVSNTALIADRCNLEIAFPGPKLPKCNIPPQYRDDAEYLTALAYEGLPKRYPNAGEEEMNSLKKRLQHELDIIISMDFPSYFLIVQDYINWAKNHGIPVGPGRGSGAGSLVAYSLRITNVDPIKYDLLFERFLNPERVSLPDFDIDFDYERRGEVIRYVSDHYGADHVGQIVTFSQEKPKQIFKDVARVFGLSVAESNEITALVPDEIPDKKHWNIADAMEYEPKLKALSTKNNIYRKVFEHAQKLEGLNRHTSLHAAGVVIGREKLDEYVPVMADRDGHAATQFTMNEIEKCGLVKMDFLGLKTLTLIRNTEELIRKKDPSFSIDDISMEDKAVFDMLSRGDAACVFQFESGGMRRILVESKPRCIEDLVALNALYRPGPMQFIPQYIDCKLGRKKISYPDPCLEDILKNTYGVIVYQEQVMQVAQRIAGYSLGEADILRRIMGKKKVDKMAEELAKFRTRAEQNGFNPDHAEEIFHILEPFAGYGFNKSHAVAYTIVAYQTAWLKCHYRAEFMAANLTNEMGSPDKFKEYLALAVHDGIRVLPPSINVSGAHFSVSCKGDIVYGLEGIKFVGTAPTRQIVSEREKNGPYRSFTDFVVRQPEQLSSKVYEGLIRTGCFDVFGEERAALLLNVKDVLKWDKQYRTKQHAPEQLSLFEDSELEERHFDFKPAAPMTLLEMLKGEKELLGFYISGHPTDVYRDDIDRCVSIDLSDPSTIRVGEKTSIVGEVTAVRNGVSKKTNKPYAFFTLSTREGKLETGLFGDAYDDSAGLLRENNVIAVRGAFIPDPKTGALKFKLDEVTTPDALPAKPISILHIRMNGLASVKDARILKETLDALKSDEGIRVMISTEDNPGEEILINYRIAPASVNIPALRKLRNILRVWTE